MLVVVQWCDEFELLYLLFRVQARHFSTSPVSAKLVTVSVYMLISNYLRCLLHNI